MVAGRKRVLGEIAAYQIAGIVAHIPFGGQALDPNRIHPYGMGPPEKPPSEARRRRETQAAFKILERALFGRVIRD